MIALLLQSTPTASTTGIVEYLTIFVLAMLPLAVWRAHTHRVADHRRIMILMFSGALVVAGLFTLLPGRIMHTVVFGG